MNYPLPRISPQVVLRWALASGQAVIPKSSNPAHIAANKQLDFELSAAEMLEIDVLNGKIPPKLA